VVFRHGGVFLVFDRFVRASVPAAVVWATLSYLGPAADPHPRTATRVPLVNWAPVLFPLSPRHFPRDRRFFSLEVSQSILPRCPKLGLCLDLEAIGSR